MPEGPFFRTFEREAIQRSERAALIATDRAALMAKDTLRQQMRGAGLGRLGNAIGSTSDLKKGGRIKRRGRLGFSASGVVYIRGRSERTHGAIEAYTEGAEILPVRSRWLWIATDQIPARVGRYRMTPSRYRSGGLEERIGPLVEIKGRNSGERLLIVRNVTTSAKPRSARRLPRRGGVRAGRELQESVVAFVGIRRTSRQARVDARAIISGIQRSMPELLRKAYGEV